MFAKMIGVFIGEKGFEFGKRGFESGRGFDN